MTKIPLIIDTDPGVDDTIALIMSLAYEGFDLIGLTTVGGNVSLEYTSANANNIVALTGRDVPVVKGANKPLIKELVTASHIHGINGMGSIKLEASKRDFLDIEVEDFIYNEALKHSGQLRILTLGPLTNIAKTILKYPDLEQHIHSIVSMGGAMGVGNVTPAAEYNIYADPDSAKIVFDSQVKVVMVGLDVTIPTVVTPDQNKLIRAVNNPVADVVADLVDYGLSKESPYNSKGAIMHDPLAASYLMDPSVLKTSSYFVDIECESDLTRGATLVDLYRLMGEADNVDVAMEADNDLFFELLMERLKSYK